MKGETLGLTQGFGPSIWSYTHKKKKVEKITIK